MPKVNTDTKYIEGSSDNTRSLREIANNIKQQFVWEMRQGQNGCHIDGCGSTTSNINSELFAFLPTKRNMLYVTSKNTDSCLQDSFCTDNETKL